MRRKTLGIIVMAVVAVMAISAQTALAGPIQSVTACLKMEPGVPLGTAVYSWWDDETSRLEISVAGAVPGTYCVFIDKVKMEFTFTVDDAGAGSLRLDTRWGDVIPVIASGSTISMKNCADTTIVLCGMFK
ncbi:MAG: hypothetical protein QG582_1382 [Candidatus Thermoplasmatota archaeon]|nr:hypothetical protein [Candidatus Thermoplasmatota archaeon]